MVSAKTIIILGGIGIFFLAGGVGLSQSALAQVKTDFSSIRGGVSERVTNVKQTIQRETGQEVGLTKEDQLQAQEMALPIAEDSNRVFGDFGKDFERGGNKIGAFPNPDRDPRRDRIALPFVGIPSTGIRPPNPIGEGRPDRGLIFPDPTIPRTGGKQFDRSRGNIIRTADCRAGECETPRTGGKQFDRTGKNFGIFTRDTGIETSGAPDVQFGVGFTKPVGESGGGRIFDRRPDGFDFRTQDFIPTNPRGTSTIKTQAQKIADLRSRGGFGQDG